MLTLWHNALPLGPIEFQLRQLHIGTDSMNLSEPPASTIHHSHHLRLQQHDPFDCPLPYSFDCTPIAFPVWMDS